MPDNISNSRAAQIVDQLFDSAVEQNASDVHIVVGKKPLFRINGEIIEEGAWKEMTSAAAKEFSLSILSEKEQAKFIEERELDVAHQTASGLRFRVNLHWEKGNVSMAARAIPTEIPQMDDLDLPEIVRKMVNLPHGIVLVTGPTGSGKSTTLASMINTINQERAENIITLEDPIEFLFKADKSIIRQRQLGRDFISFNKGLKHILRQDPDVVMVGEMRDSETIETALTIAETGHLVFATLHTYSAAQTIDRIIDAFPAHQQNQVRAQVALTLRGVISQQLLPSEEGGRIAAREVLVNNAAVANLVRENKIPQIKNVLQTSSGEGMFTLVQDLNRLVKEKKVTSKTAKHYIVGMEKLDSDDDEEEAKEGKGKKKKRWGK